MSFAQQAVPPQQLAAINTKITQAQDALQRILDAQLKEATDRAAAQQLEQEAAKLADERSLHRHAEIMATTAAQHNALDGKLARLPAEAAAATVTALSGPLTEAYKLVADRMSPLVQSSETTHQALTAILSRLGPPPTQLPPRLAPSSPLCSPGAHTPR